MTRRRLLVAFALGALLVGPACSVGGDVDDGFRLTLDGAAEVGDRELDDGDHSIAAGETVRVVEGRATLSLPGDREIRLREGTSLVVQAEPELLDGDAVVVAGDETRVVAGDVEVAIGAGAARLQRGVGTTIAMYGGDAAVASAGRALDGGLPALRQVTVPAEGQLPRDPSPLVYDEDDTWDRDFLGDAISLGHDLDGLSRGFTAQLGPSATMDAELLADVLPIEVDDRLVDADERSPGETLVGAAIVVESGEEVDDGWNEVFGFREEGAEWGLVALDQQVERDPLLGTLDGAFDASPLLFSVGDDTDTGTTVGTTVTTAPGTTPSTQPPTTEPPDDDDPEDPGDPDDPVPPLTVPPITIPPVVPDDPPDDPAPTDPVDGVVDLVGDVLDGDPLDELLGNDT
jgi:hypothetical protein